MQHKHNETLQTFEQLKNANNETETYKQKCHAYQDVNNQLSMIVKDREDKLAEANKQIHHLKDTRPDSPFGQVSLAAAAPSLLSVVSNSQSNSSKNSSSNPNVHQQINNSDEILVLKRERDDAIKASERRRQEMQTAKDKNSSLNLENDKLKKELTRLKHKAEEMMHSHNEDLLHYQHRENETLEELARAEQRLKNLQFTDQSEGRQAQLKLDTLNEEVRGLFS